MSGSYFSNDELSFDSNLRSAASLNSASLNFAMLLTSASVRCIARTLIINTNSARVEFLGQEYSPFLGAFVSAL